MTEIFEPRPGAGNPVDIDAVKEAAQEAVRSETAPRPTRRYRALLFQIYVLVVIGIFAAMAALASTSAYFPIDVAITQFLQTHNPAWFDLLMRATSWLGYSVQGTLILILTVILLDLLGLRWEAVMAAIAGVGTEALNGLLKYVIHRPRPEANIVHVVLKLKGYSFPSGHVMFYVGFFGFLLFLAYTLLKPSWKRTLLMLFFAALIVLVGPSRIYLGEHWASDVLGAYLAGSLALAGAILIYRWGKSRFFVRQPVAPEKAANN